VSHASANPNDPLQRLVGMIRERTGNVIPPSRMPFLEEVAQRRAQSKGLPAIEDYVRALEADQMAAEWENLIPLVTIKESYFFRAPQQWEIIRNQVLPGLLQARAATRQLRIWSAACARGEEPATLAMILAEEKALAHWSWSILATDVDEDALAGARLGLYGDRAVGQVPPELLGRYFTRRGKLFELSAAIRSRIHYMPLNLAHPPFDLPYPELDLILLRNVLIYFRRPLQRRVVLQVGQTLAKDGYLFLGASETLWQVQEELEPVDLGSCFCYRHRRETREAGARMAPLAPAPPKRVRPPVVPEPATRIQPILVPDSRERDSRLRSRPTNGSETNGFGTNALGNNGSGNHDFGSHAAGNGNGQNGAPPSVLPKAPEPASPIALPLSVQERLLQAARCLAGNRIEEADQAIKQVLAQDPSEPAAHALEGFLHDVSGRPDDAVASYRAALYLDPELFQVRVLLADCLLRLGNRDRAEHHYREVLTYLANGRERNLVVSTELPFPDRTRAQRRCRQVLGGG
jgi:chemotaxis protein methyltransferase CheR